MPATQQFLSSPGRVPSGGALTLAVVWLVTVALPAASVSFAQVDAGDGEWTTASEEADTTTRPASSGRAPDPESEIAQNIAGLLDALRSTDKGLRPAHLDTLSAVYAGRGYMPIWLDQDEPTEVVGQLLAAIKATADHGFEPVDHYDLEGLERKLARVRDGKGGPEQQAAFDVGASCALLCYTMDIGAGRVDPTGLSIPWDFGPRTVLTGKWLRMAADGETLPALDDLAPLHGPYLELRRKLELYRKYCAQGGWQKVAGSATLHPGQEGAGETVRSLRRRLTAEGFLLIGAMGPAMLPSRAANEDDRAVMDSSLTRALRRFQASRGLKVDGILGPNTRKALDHTAEEIVDHIAVNLERWRWLPEKLPRRRIQVNVPAYELTVHEQGRVVRRMKVIVGQEAWSTPAFRDELQYVVFNPYWFVPRTIALAELLPKIKDDSSILREENYRVFASWEDAAADHTPDTAALEPDSLDWAEVTPANFTSVLRKEPGPSNPLGRIKFMMPNHHAIYLHDTPARGLFDERERSLSHGCIRIEDPRWLAEYVLSDSLRIAAADTARARQADSDGPVRYSVNLPEPLPVYILYFTAYVNAAGDLILQDDLYGMDKQILQAMDRSPACPGDSEIRSRKGHDP